MDLRTDEELALTFNKTLPIFRNRSGRPFVTAKDLHTILKIKRPFESWILLKTNLTTMRGEKLKEGKDFIQLSDSDWLLTISTAVAFFEWEKPSKLGNEILKELCNLELEDFKVCTLLAREQENERKRTSTN